MTADFGVHPAVGWMKKSFDHKLPQTRTPKGSMASLVTKNEKGNEAYTASGVAASRVSEALRDCETSIELVQRSASNELRNERYNAHLRVLRIVLQIKEYGDATGHLVALAGSLVGRRKGSTSGLSVAQLRKSLADALAQARVVGGDATYQVLQDMLILSIETGDIIEGRGERVSFCVHSSLARTSSR